jgi:hypothetical protein
VQPGRAGGLEEEDSYLCQFDNLYIYIYICCYMYILYVAACLDQHTSFAYKVSEWVCSKDYHLILESGPNQNLPYLILAK